MITANSIDKKCIKKFYDDLADTALGSALEVHRVVEGNQLANPNSRLEVYRVINYYKDKDLEIARRSKLAEYSSNYRKRQREKGRGSK